MKPFITSLLTNDFYKFTMQQLVLGRFSNVKVEYKFFNRGKTRFPKGFDKKLQEHVNALGELELQPDEANFLRRKAPFLKESYLEWLERFRPDPSYVHITQTDGDLDIRVIGPWYKTIYWEVPLMAIISELFYQETQQLPDKNYLQRASKKFALLQAKGLTYADFGLRRRYSGTVHENVLIEMIKFAKESGSLGGFVGTSNVELAYKYDQRPIGTMAHELPMVLACIYGFQSANEVLLNSWQDEFNGDLGIALTDTFTTKVFLRSFGRKHAAAFDGVRQDSGDPEEYVDMIIKHYKNMGIDPTTKTITFSDSLNPYRAIEIAEYCKGRIKCSFGIGTNFTNDVGVVPLNMVIKAYKAGKSGWPMLPTVKLSDSSGKVTGDIKTAKMARFMLGI